MRNRAQSIQLIGRFDILRNVNAPVNLGLVKMEPPTFNIDHGCSYINTNERYGEN
jgi:hypothetical protein